MKRLSLYITPSHASVTVQNGVSRETSASTVSEMIDGMPDQDRRTLEAFCTAVANYINDNDGVTRTALAKVVVGDKA